MDTLPDRTTALYARHVDVGDLLAGPAPEVHRYELADGSPQVENLLAEIEHDPTSIFWG